MDNIPINDYVWEIAFINCGKCANYTDQLRCRAFPNGIPSSIIDGLIDHTKPYPGDNGVIFEQKNEV